VLTPRHPRLVRYPFIFLLHTTHFITDKEDKPKRAPSAYNLFVQAHMKEWKEAHPGAPIKEAMSEVRICAYICVPFMSDAPQRLQQCGGKHPRTQIAARSQNLGSQRLRLVHLKLAARRNRPHHHQVMPRTPAMPATSASCMFTFSLSHRCTY
jgi:hypothetical protein